MATEHHPDLTFAHPDLPSAEFALWKGWDADQRLRDYLGQAKTWARWPHHSASTEALLGVLAWHPYYREGQVYQARPGELLLAGAGVLCLQDLPEFKRETIEHLAKAWRGEVALRTPHGGAAAVVHVQARCSVYATAQACPCGFADRSDATCRCTPEALKRWATRLDYSLARFRGVKVLS